MARQAALLLLTVHGSEIPVHAVDNDFYRQALELDLRSKREYTEAILNAMGGVTKQRLNQFKQLLQLSDEAWELADRYCLEEGVLRYLLDLPTEDQAEMIQQIIQLGLTGSQIKSIVQNGLGQDTAQLADPVENQAFKFAKTLKKSLNKQNPFDFANAILTQEGDKDMAYAYLSRVERFIQDAKKFLGG